uniref:Matrix remodeling associated 7 n=14 Tax=Boreoeutheria TaxID=1437010 RepID=K7EQX8_HUMAN
MMTKEELEEEQRTEE